MRLRYISYSQLASDVTLLGQRVRPQNFAGIVGLPRSGMIPATMLAAHLGLPCVGLGEFLECGGFPRPFGERMQCRTVPDTGLVLVLDDSCYLGGAMRRAKDLIASLGPMCYRYQYAAVYRAPETPAGELHYAVREIPKPRVFAWNLTHNAELGSAMLDFDGVLCSDPRAVDDGGPAYEEALRTALPLLLPSVPVAEITTGRLERWRSISESWLAAHGVQYGKLNMAEFDTPDDRRRAGGAARWKGAVYRQSDCRLFIESHDNQAEEIAEVSGKPVLSIQGQKVYEKQ